jgi:hypothetical protein
MTGIARAEMHTERMGRLRQGRGMILWARASVHPVNPPCGTPTGTRRRWTRSATAGSASVGPVAVGRTAPQPSPQPPQPTLTIWLLVLVEAANAGLGWRSRPAAAAGPAAREEDQEGGRASSSLPPTRGGARPLGGLEHQAGAASGHSGRTDQGLEPAPEARDRSYLCTRNTVKPVVSVVLEREFHLCTRAFPRRDSGGGPTS